MSRVSIVFRTAASLCLAIVLPGHAGTSWLGAQPASAATAQASAAELSLNDVSWLFPLPRGRGDVISMEDLYAIRAGNSSKPDPIWSDEAFYQLLSFATSDRARDAGSRLDLPDEARSRSAWYISAVRFDPGSPGLSPAIAKQFGQSPQIRLSVQPLGTDSSGALKVHDLAVHLIFSFRIGKKAPAQRGCLRRSIADDGAFMRIVEELAILRNDLAAVGAPTRGEPLGVHPALLNHSTAGVARDRLKALLQRHLSAERLDGMAIAGLSEAPPGTNHKWVFLAMQNLLPGELSAYPSGGWVPLRGPGLDGKHFAEVFDPSDAGAPLKPTPHPNNLNPITCKNYVLGPNAITHPAGYSTAEIFRSNPRPTPEKQYEIFQAIRDPTKSHIFNTDCVTCHTETSLAHDSIGLTDLDIPMEYQPLNKFNVRNFGWGHPEAPAATVTRRTLNDTRAVLTEINGRILKSANQHLNPKPGGD